MPPELDPNIIIGQLILSIMWAAFAYLACIIIWEALKLIWWCLRYLYIEVNG
jgi:hypothetical protein